MYKTSFLLAAAALLFSCSTPDTSTDNADQNENAQNIKRSTANPEDNSEYHESEINTKTEETVQNSPAIKLNNGKRWEINSEMKPHLQKGRLLVLGYLGEGMTDYKKLAEEVKEQNAKLIESCTMEGEPHEQLHNWLYPHLELTKKFEQASSPEEANKIVEQLLESYNTFEKYFKLD